MVIDARALTPRAKKKRHGITLVHTGDGKGKSSSAFGMVFRAAAWGMRVCVIQFIKGKWATGEQKAAAQFENIEWHALGDGFTWDTKNPEQDIQTSRNIWALCQDKIRTENYDLLVFDEINYCISYGWLNAVEVASWIAKEKPSWMHLVLTGRDAAPEMIAIADTVTEMCMVKHVFEEKGIKAQQGIEF